MIFVSIVLLTSCGINDTSNPSTDPGQTVSPDQDTATKSPWKTVVKSEFKKTMFTLTGFVNDSSGIVMGFDGAIHFTNDAGKTWSNTKSNAINIYGIDYLDEKNVYTCGEAGSIRFSNDSGQTWTKLADYEPEDQNPFYYLSFPNQKFGWAATSYKLCSTTDGGTTWTTLEIPEACKQIASVNLISETDGFLLDTLGNLYITADGGTNWSQKSLNLNDNERINGLMSAQAAALRFIDADNGLVVFLNRDNKVKAMRTLDGGSTWNYEALPELNPGYIYLTRDLQTLTIASASLTEITVLKYGAQ